LQKKTNEGKNVIKIQSTTETIESKGGLILAGKIAMKAGLAAIKSASANNAGIILTTLYGLMAEGKNDFESVGEKRGSLFFQEAFGLPRVYAKETVRLYIEKMASNADEVIGQLRESSCRIIKQAPLRGVRINGICYIPVDIDTTVMDNRKTKKEGVSWTYQGVDGYHPIIAYVGTEGYMLDCELRPGSQHCQNGTAAFIEGAIQQLKDIKAGGRMLFRLDSGNDSFDTLKAATAAKTHYCIIKRNKRLESDEKWLETARRQGKRIEARKGKKTWIGRIGTHPSRKEETLEDVSIVYEVTERKTDARGNRLLFPEIEVNSWWTNLGCEAEKVIELYHGHATSEQFHAELKSDMGVERLPSGKMAVNKIVLAVTMNAFNTLRVLGQKPLWGERAKEV
jgi:hypothetical protein